MTDFLLWLALSFCREAKASLPVGNSTGAAVGYCPMKHGKKQSQQTGIGMYTLITASISLVTAGLVITMGTLLNGISHDFYRSGSGSSVGSRGAAEDMTQVGSAFDDEDVSHGVTSLGAVRTGGGLSQAQTLLMVDVKLSFMDMEMASGVTTEFIEHNTIK